MEKKVQGFEPQSAGDYFIVHLASNIAMVLSVLILIVGIVALVLQFRALKGISATPSDILRTSAVTLIVTFSLAMATFLDHEDLKSAAPVFGIFGTIAGYLLGSAQGQKTE
ncbi:MAG: hypothetical protein JOY64_04645 [Alphaproteobacteria bacterium]|nr:hypothetical protein [Alphaproteobacteria bacterium]MBV8406897.1 hypothetical protein [Alphaproteobacteria bacterium]